MALPLNPPIDLDEIYDEAVDGGYSGTKNLNDLDNHPFVHFPNPQSAPRPSVLAFLGANAAGVTFKDVIDNSSDSFYEYGIDQDIVSVFNGGGQLGIMTGVRLQGATADHWISFLGITINSGGGLSWDGYSQKISGSDGVSDDSKIKAFSIDSTISGGSFTTFVVFWRSGSDIKARYMRYTHATNTLSFVGNSVETVRTGVSAQEGSWDVDFLRYDPSGPANYGDIEFAVACNDSSGNKIYTNFINFNNNNGDLTSITGWYSQSVPINTDKSISIASIDSGNCVVSYCANGEGNVRIVYASGGFLFYGNEHTWTTSIQPGVVRSIVDIKGVDTEEAIIAWTTSSGEGALKMLFFDLSAKTITSAYDETVGGYRMRISSGVDTNEILLGYIGSTGSPVNFVRVDYTLGGVITPNASIEINSGEEWQSVKSHDGNKWVIVARQHNEHQYVSSYEVLS